MSDSIIIPRVSASKRLLKRYWKKMYSELPVMLQTGYQDKELDVIVLIRFATPVSMRNEWTTIRLKHKVPGNKFDRKIAFGIPLIKEENGKLTKVTDNKWINQSIMCPLAA